MSLTTREREFVDELFRVSRKLRTLFDARVKEWGMSQARARLMLKLAGHEGVSQADLAEIMHVEQPTMAKLLDGLENAGLIKRSALKGDRRAKAIAFTAAGRKQAAEVNCCADELRQQVLKGLSDADLAAATRVLRAVADNIGDASEADEG